MAGGLEHPIALIPEAINAVGIHLPEPFGANHVVTTWAVMLFLFLIGFIASKNLTLVPGKLQNLFEVLIGGLEDFVVGNIGEEGRRVYPVLIGLFIFILTSNWCGLIPGVDAPTANVNTNAAMAIFLFSYYNIIGIMKWGPGYIKHFLGPIGFLAPLMLVLEIISHLARPLSLTLRLFGNIRGEEIVLILMFSLAPILGSLPMYFLFMLGKFIQAFIFFMLGMIYLKGSLEHAH